VYSDEVRMLPERPGGCHAFFIFFYEIRSPTVAGLKSRFVNRASKEHSHPGCGAGGHPARRCA